MDLLVRAICERRVVEFRYHGEHRTLEPYRLGRDNGGRLLLTGWQSRKGWRTFQVAEIAEAEATERTFDTPREGYVRGDDRLERILAEV